PVGLVGLCQRSRLPQLIEGSVQKSSKEVDTLLKTFSHQSSAVNNTTMVAFIVNLINSFTRENAQAHIATPDSPPLTSPLVSSSSSHDGVNESSSTSASSPSTSKPLVASDEICVNINSCGHFVHIDCLTKFLETKRGMVF